MADGVINAANLGLFPPGLVGFRPGPGVPQAVVPAGVVPGPGGDKQVAWFRRLLTLLLCLLVAAVLGAWWYAQRVLPQTQGTLSLPGLQAPVQVRRDAHGIPTIEAASVADALFGLGVVHVQDRLWQMETHRRIGAGRLAEAFGEGALDADRFLRILGVRRVAAAQWARLQTAPDGAAARDALRAYTAGVNAALAQLKARPPEFVLLQLQPEPWAPEDSLAWVIMMGLDLGANWQAEALRLRLALALPKARIDELMPPYADEPVPPSMDYAAFYKSLGLGPTQKAALDGQLQRLLARAPEAEQEGLGSNSWVLAPSRTTTGAPLLANDPHLKLSTPALWYFARLKAPGLDVAGATLPGLPGVVVGQNASLAWGFTNTGPDVQDTYLERLHADDPQRYQTPDGWAAFETRQETIKVRGQPEVALTVRSTRHGPVISDAAAASGLGGPALAAAAGQPGFVLALRWTGLDTDADPVGTVLGMMQAASVDAFIAAARRWATPVQNMAVADREGRIALFAPGRVPLRRPDNDLSGLAPAPGWDARYDWQGHLPADQMPLIRDPERGYIANANQKVVGPDYPHFLSHTWAAPYRHHRIEQLLDAKPRHSLDDLRAVQADQLSLAAARLLPTLAAVSSSHPLAAAAKAQLKGFNGQMAADRAAPLIFWAWQRQLSQRVLADETGQDLYDRLLGQRGYFDAIERIMARGDAWWCDDKTTPATETCPQQAQAAFDAALDELQTLQGPDPAAWQWGKAHQARGEHRPFSRVKPLARFFETRQPVGGDTYTVNVSRVGLRPDASTGEHYLDEHGPSLRGLYDLADRGQSRVVHSTGQSGIPWSPLYRSLAKPWGQVQDVPLFPQASTYTDTLTLQPAGR